MKGAAAEGDYYCQTEAQRGCGSWPHPLNHLTGQRSKQLRLYRAAAAPLLRMY